MLVGLEDTANLGMRASSPHPCFSFGAARQGPVNHELIGRPRSRREIWGLTNRWAGQEIYTNRGVSVPHTPGAHRPPPESLMPLGVRTNEEYGPGKEV